LATCNILDDSHEPSSVNKSNFVTSEFLYKQVASILSALTPSDELTEAARLDETSLAKLNTSAAASECRVDKSACSSNMLTDISKALRSRSNTAVISIFRTGVGAEDGAGVVDAVVVVVVVVVVGAGVGGALDSKAVVGVEGSGVGGGANDGAGVGENDGAAVSGAVVGKAVVEVVSKAVVSKAVVSGVGMSAESVDSPVVAVGSVVAGGKVVAVGNGVAPQIFHPDRVT